MGETLLISVDPGEVRYALLCDGRLVEYAVEHAEAASLVGNIYAGRVGRVVPGVRAAFVDCGLERSAFLPFDDAGGGLFEGQSLLVQVRKDPVGDKGALVTARPALAGRLLVLCPQSQGVTVSRRIADGEESRRLERIAGELAQAGGGAIIVRTLAQGAARDELAADFEALARGWAEIAARAADAAPPALVHSEPGPVERALRERAGWATAAVVVDDRAALAAARAYCRRAVPALEDRLALHRGPETLFARYAIEDEVESLLAGRISLPSGGAITIERTEALTVVDVDSAAAAGGAEAALAANREAAAEVARQLRLRNIAGLVVVDFIGMAAAGARARVMAALGEALAADPAPVRIAPMSRFGVVELTRRRMRPALAEMLTEPCPACAGRGRIKTARAVAAEVVRAGLAAARAAPGRALAVAAAPEVARALCAGQGDLARAVERAAGAPLRVRGDPSRARDSFEVSVASADEGGRP